MRSILFIISCLLAFALPAAAQTYTIGDTTPSDSDTIDFNGLSELGGGEVLVDGLTASMTYLLQSVTHDGGDNTNDWLLQISVTNTSTAPTTSNVTAVGFDMGGYESIISASADGVYFTEVDPDGHFPMGLGNLDVCVTGFNGQCSGNGGGLAEGESETFYLMLTMSDAIESFTMSDFAVRYQAIYSGEDFNGASGIGLVTTVPEPATWLMMIIGFGIVSASTRRTRYKTRVVHS